MYGVLQFLTGVAGIVLALVVTGAVIWFIRAPLSQVLQQLIGDKAVAEVGARFVLILLGLYGLRAALGYITQPQLTRLFGGLVDLLTAMAGAVQWVAQIAALLFIGYSLQAKLSTKPKDEG